MHLPSRLALGLLLALAASCAKKIGDSCSLNTDCSINADRVCDLAQAGGYCTVPGCEPGGCPTDSVCVFFDAHAPRLRRRYCMAGCSADSDCREGYQCVPSSPAACLQSTTEVLPAGTTCNRIADPNPASTGWCVQRP